MNMNKSLKKIASLSVLGLAFGMSIAGCGSGGSDGAGSGSAVSKYLADQQGGGFVVDWWYVGSPSAVAKAFVSTAIPSGTNQYNHTVSNQALIGGTWGTDPSPYAYYDLVPSGWLAGPDTAILVDSGNGTDITITPTGESAIAVAVTRTELANTPIACTNPNTGATITCPAPGNYPAGSAAYLLTLNFASNRFLLYGAGMAAPVTDSNGTPLTALPALNTTFCDPAFPFVFAAQGGNSYNVFSTTSCTQTNISAAIATASPLGTVVINNQPTGNATNVTNVLRVMSATGAATVTVMVDMIYSERANAVWYGWMSPAGTYPGATEKNKIATNAQLVASGLPAFP